MLKRVKTEIDLATTNEVLNLAAKNGAELRQIEGVLNDSYLIYNTETETGKRIRFGRRKPRKYILLTHEYAHAWGNRLYVIETDSDKEAKEFEEEYEAFIDEMMEEE